MADDPAAHLNQRIQTLSDAVDHLNESIRRYLTAKKSIAKYGYVHSQTRTRITEHAKTLGNTDEIDEFLRSLMETERLCEALGSVETHRLNNSGHDLYELKRGILAMHQSVVVDLTATRLRIQSTSPK